MNYYELITDNNFIKWSVKFGYSFYVNIFKRLSVEKKNADGKFHEKTYNIDDDKFVELIMKSVDEDKDYIAEYLNDSVFPDEAII